jgi:hypothetical protein
MHEGEQGQDISIKVHLWRAEMLTGVVELDKDGIIQKAGCCALHQPGKSCANDLLLHECLLLNVFSFWVQQGLLAMS